MHAHRVDSREEMRAIARSAVMSDGFVRPFNDLVKAYTDYPLDASPLMVEALLDTFIDLRSVVLARWLLCSRNKADRQWARDALRKICISSPQTRR